MISQTYGAIIAMDNRLHSTKTSLQDVSHYVGQSTLYVLHIVLMFRYYAVLDYP